MRKNARVLIAYGSGDAPGMLRNRGKMALEGTLRLKMLPSGSVNLGRLGLGGQDGGLLPSCTEQKWRWSSGSPGLAGSTGASSSSPMAFLNAFGISMGSPDVSLTPRVTNTAYRVCCSSSSAASTYRVPVSRSHAA